MKKKYFLFMLVLLIPFILKAQITITQTDIAGIGTDLIEATDTFPVGITPGSPGTNQTWDFSTLADDLTVSLHFVDPASTTYSSSFPMSNLAINITTNDNYYLNKSSSSVVFWGLSGNFLGTGAINALVYNNPETMVTFPSTYNTSFTDTSFYDRKFYYGQTVTIPPYPPMFIDSVRVKQINYITSTIDAWGTATTPDGAFPVIRQNILKNTIDSIWVRIEALSTWYSYQQASYNTQEYNYDGNNIGYPLVYIEYYPDSNVIKKVDWTRAIPVSINETQFAKHISVYPDPASDFIYVDFNKNENIYAVLYDVTGKEVMNTGIISGDKIVIPVSNIGNGLYFIKVFDRNGFISSDKIQIIH